MELDGGKLRVILHNRLLIWMFV